MLGRLNQHGKKSAAVFLWGSALVLFFVGPSGVWATLTGGLLFAVSAWNLRNGAPLGRFGTSEWFPPMLVVGLTAALFWPLLLLEMPYSADHPVHLTRAWHFLTRNLASGQLSGWSDLWFGGWPSGEDYPPLGDYWYALWYGLTAGTLGWEGTYAVTFLSMMSAAALGVYWFGRTALGRWEGLVGALLFLSDKGAYREGGWTYTVTWGVWPQVLSTGLCFAALGTFILLARRPSPSRFAWASLFTGLAFLGHPMALIFFAVLVPLGLVLTYIMHPSFRTRALALPPAAIGVGIGLAAYWFFPFASKGAWMAKYGELWLSLPAMGERWLAGTLFSGTTPLVIWLGTLGGIAGVLRGKWGATFCAAGALAFVLAASRTLFHELDLLALSPSFGQIQFQRFVIPAKPLVFVLAGHGLVLVFSSARARDALRQVSMRRTVAVALVVGGLTGPFLHAATGKWSEKYGVGELTLKEDRRHQKDYEDFLEWSRDALRGETFARVAYVRPYNDHFFAAAPIWNELPAYKVGFTPCTNFIHKADLGTDENYRLLSVRYVVSLEDLRRRSLREIKRFGQLRVYEFKEYSPDRFNLEGKGSVVSADVRPGDGFLEFDLDGTSENSTLVVHIPPFPNWTATNAEGETLDISSREFGNFGSRMVVPAHTEQIRFEYRAMPVNLWSGVVSGVLWIFLFGLFYPRFASFFGTRAQRVGTLPLIRDASFIPWGGGVALVGIAVLLLRPLPASNATNQVSEAEVWVETESGERKECGWSDGRFRCSEESWHTVHRTETRIGKVLRRCIWAHPPRKGSLHIRWSNLNLGGRLTGFHGLADASFGRKKTHGSTSVGLRLNDGEQASIPLSKRRGWHPWSLDVDANTIMSVEWIVRAKNASKQHYCFDWNVNEDSQKSALEK